MPSQSTQFGDAVYSKTYHSYSDAKTRAIIAANQRQAAMTIWESETGRGEHKYWWFRPSFDGPPDHSIGGMAVVEVEQVVPDPGGAPVNRWPIVDQQGFTELSMRDVRAAAWREFSRRMSGSTNGRQRYRVSTGEKKVRIVGRSQTLYWYIVRANPSFTDTPHLP